MPPHSGLLSQLYRLTSPPPGDAELLRRWVKHRDEDAFTALVSRHGRMVHGVCRRVLGNSHDAEDAFQAVFLTLARKAATLRHPEALPGWLHGVAVRLACKARTAAVRRRCGDQGASASEPPDPHPDPLDTLSARELLGLIDREIARLPDTYRLPLVLCDLEGRTQGEAAHLLGWTLGSFRGRLLRGRERLRTRLARRGIAPTVLAAACVQTTTDAAVLTASVSRLAVRFVSCLESVPISPSVAVLVREGTRGMILTRLKLASVVLLAACTLVAGAGLLAWSTSTPQPADERAEDNPPPAPVSVKPQVRRDQAGDPLPPGALSRLGTTRLRHGGGIFELAFGPDGKTLVSCGRGHLRFWDAATGTEVRRFPEQLRVRNIAVSPDGKLLAMRVYAKDPKENFIAFHEFATGRLLHRFTDGEARFLNHFLFSPDGKVLAASSSQEGILKLWDSANGRPLHTLKHKADCRLGNFSADGKILLSFTRDTIHSTIHFWDVATGKKVRQIKHDNDRLLYIALSPDGKLLASIDSIGWHPDSRVRLWDAASGRQLRELAVPVTGPAPKFPMMFWTMAFAPDGKALLTGGTDGVLRVWDTATGRELRQISGFSTFVSTFAFAPDGKTLAVVDVATIRVFDFASGTERVPSLGHRGQIASISVTPDGQTVVTSDDYKVLRFWELATGRELQSRAVTGTFLQRTSPSRLQTDGRTYLTFEENRIWRLRNLADGKELAGLRGHELRSPSVLAPDGKTLAARAADGKVNLLDPATGAVRHALNPPKVKDDPQLRPAPPALKAVWEEAKNERSFWGMSFTSDGRTLVIWNIDQVVTVWDVASGKMRRQFTAPIQQSMPLGALSPDGKLLAFGTRNNAPHTPILHVLDAATGKEIRRFTTAKEGFRNWPSRPTARAWPGAATRTGRFISAKSPADANGRASWVIAAKFSRWYSPPTAKCSSPAPTTLPRSSGI